MIKPIFFIFVFFSILACQRESTSSDSPFGLWRLEMDLGKDKPQLPFFITIQEVNDTLKAALWNGKEYIIQGGVHYREDSLIIESAIFQSELVLKQRLNNMNGYWLDKARPGTYKIPVSGKFNLNQRFSFDSTLSNKIDGKWQTSFSPNTTQEYPAIGLFATDSFEMNATFVTETGDYRFLAGGFDGNSLKLSTFDGAHAFLFEAELANDTLQGTFYSGKHYSEPFMAFRNSSFSLTDPYAMNTSSKERIDFAGIGLNGKTIHFEDMPKTKSGWLIQIMGTWCPNCYDETRFLVQHYDSIQKLGFDVVSLAFEKSDSLAALKQLARYKSNLNVPYSILYTGNYKKSEASKKITFLDEVKSYPTLIYVSKDGSIQGVHTGYYGPNTGELNKNQTRLFFQKLNQMHSL